MSDPKKQHPLVEKILSLVTFDPMYENLGMPDPKVLYLSDDARAEINKEFEKYFDPAEITSAIIALLDLSNVFAKEEHKEIGITILEIVVTAREALEKISKAKKYSQNGLS